MNVRFDKARFFLIMSKMKGEKRLLHVPLRFPAGARRLLLLGCRRAAPVIANDYAEKDCCKRLCVRGGEQGAVFSSAKKEIAAGTFGSALPADGSVTAERESFRSGKIKFIRYFSEACRMDSGVV